jgi:hypothetical protein
MSLPSKLLYQTKVEPAAAKAGRSNIQPQNGTDGYAANSTITFNLPTRNNLVFVPSESYLKFNAVITNSSATAGTYYRLDSNGAHGFIQRIRVFHGSNLIEDIDNYSMLAKMMMDVQVSNDATYGKYSILAGTCNDKVGSPSTVAWTATGTAGTAPTGTAVDAAVATLITSINASKSKVLQANRGALLNIGDVAQTGTVTTQIYCLNLVSIIGTLCNEKYFPLFACTSAPIRVEIQLAPNLLNVVATDQAGTFVVNNVEYIMNTVELSDSAMSIIQNSLQGTPLQFTATSYRNYVWNGSIPAGGTSFAVPIPAKFSSLKSILIAQRNATNGVGTATYFPCSSCKFSLSQYYFRIGPTVYPSKYPSSSAEYFAELLKATGSMSDILNTPAIDYDSYNFDLNVACNDSVATSRPDSVHSGSFYVGLDLESFPTADRTHIFSGYNSNNDDIFYYPTFPTQTAVNVRFDAYAMHDVVYVFENNTCYIKY